MLRKDVIYSLYVYAIYFQMFPVKKKKKKKKKKVGIKAGKI